MAWTIPPTGLVMADLADAATIAFADPPREPRAIAFVQSARHTMGISPIVE